MNVDAMLRSISGRQLREWQEYARLEPFGPHREDLRAAIIAIMCALPWRKEHAEPLEPGDLFQELRGKRRRRAKEDDPAVQEAMARAWCVAAGGTVTGGLALSPPAAV